MSDRDAVLITGATGYLGRLVARQFLATSDLDVIAHGRRDYLADGDEVRGRVRSVTGDLALPGAFAGVSEEDRRRIVRIVHAGAVTRFNVDHETAEAVNVAGTSRLLELAAACPQLDRVVLLSSVYSSGLRSGVVPEAALDDEAGFANHYEASKWAAESLVAESGLPWQILRVATAVCDDAAGGITQHNAFHTTLRLCFYGLLPVLPGLPDVPLYLVTGEFVSGAVLDLCERGGDGVYNVCHTAEESIVLGEALDIAFAVFAGDPEFRRKGVLRPLLADAESFEIMAGGVGTFGGEVVSQAIQSVAPFGSQLYVPKQVVNDRLRRDLADYRAPDAASLVRAVCERLVATRWGRRVVAA